MKLKYIFFILIILLLNSCINLKDEYPDIKYYNLSQIKGKEIDIYKADALLYVRNVDISSAAYGSQIMVNWDGKRLQRYFYHRWAEDFDLIASDFISQRFQNAGVFKQGVSKTIGSALPDFILDVIINEVNIESRSNSDEINSVNLELTTSLLKRNSGEKDNEVIFNKTYKIRTVRPNNRIENVAENVSIALGKVTDEMIVDVSNSVINFINKK